MTTYLRVSLCTLIAALSVLSFGGLWVSLDLAEQLAAARQQAKAWQALALHAPENTASSTPADACSFPVACAFAGIQPLPESTGLNQAVTAGQAVVEVLGSGDEALARELQEGRMVEADRPTRGLSF